MGDADDPFTGVSPPIPRDGLAEVLGTWAGRGYLWDVLAVPLPIRDERQWSRQDLRRRAHRVLLDRVAPALSRWPARVSAWIDALPAVRTHARVIRSAPFSGVSWVDTRSHYGWPPGAFIGRETERGADTLLVTTLRWTVEYLVNVRNDAARAFPDVDNAVRDQIDAAAALLSLEPVSTAIGVMPGHPEVMALRHEGGAWNAVAEVADEFRTVESSLTDLAWRLILPDEDIRWRLFHLAVLGVVLRTLRDTGCVITSNRPLAGATAAPSYTLKDTKGLAWELWFEAAGLWKYEGEVSPYVEAVQGVPGAGRELGADILLIQPGKSALVIECKYSRNPETVARDGYHQAVTYAAEIHSRLKWQGEITSIVVGPDGVVATPSFTQLSVGRVGMVPPSFLPAAVISFLNAA